MDDICGAMIQLDLNGNITFWNSTAEIMLGYSESDVIGKNAVEHIFINNIGDEDMITVANPVRFITASTHSQRIKTEICSLSHSLHLR